MARREDGRRDPGNRPHSGGGRETSFNPKLFLYVAVHDVSFGHPTHWHTWTRIRLGFEAIHCCYCRWDIPRRALYGLYRHFGTKGQKFLVVPPFPPPPLLLLLLLLLLLFFLL